MAHNSRLATSQALYLMLPLFSHVSRADSGQGNPGCMRLAVDQIVQVKLIHVVDDLRVGASNRFQARPGDEVYIHVRVIEGVRFDHLDSRRHILDLIEIAAWPEVGLGVKRYTE